MQIHVVLTMNGAYVRGFTAGAVLPKITTKHSRVYIFISEDSGVKQIIDAKSFTKSDYVSGVKAMTSWTPYLNALEPVITNFIVDNIPCPNKILNNKGEWVEPYYPSYYNAMKVHNVSHNEMFNVSVPHNAQHFSHSTMFIKLNYQSRYYWRLSERYFNFKHMIPVINGIAYFPNITTETDQHAGDGYFQGQESNSMWCYGGNSLKGTTDIHNNEIMFLDLGSLASKDKDEDTVKVTEFDYFDISRNGQDGEKTIENDLYNDPLLSIGIDADLLQGGKTPVFFIFGQMLFLDNKVVIHTGYNSHQHMERFLINGRKISLGYGEIAFLESTWLFKSPLSDSDNYPIISTITNSVHSQGMLNTSHSEAYEDWINEYTLFIGTNFAAVIDTDEIHVNRINSIYKFGDKSYVFPKNTDGVMTDYLTGRIRLYAPQHYNDKTLCHVPYESLKVMTDSGRHHGIPSTVPSPEHYHMKANAFNRIPNWFRQTHNLSGDRMLISEIYSPVREV